MLNINIIWVIIFEKFVYIAGILVLVYKYDSINYSIKVFKGGWECYKLLKTKLN